MSIIYTVAERRYALVAQLDRVLDYESRGQGFESLGARQKKKTPPCVVSFFFSYILTDRTLENAQAFSQGFALL